MPIALRVVVQPTSRNTVVRRSTAVVTLRMSSRSDARMAPSFIIAAPTWVTSLRKWRGASSHVEAFDKFQLLLERKEPLMPTSPGPTSIA